MPQRKRVLMIYTGGTIGMNHLPGGEGYVPVAGFLGQQMAAMPELQHELVPQYTIHEYTPLLDSANMQPAEWVKIAQTVARHYDEYDGFIILHGTDTMTYTASALSFLLGNLEKTVIVTGSQIPIAEVRNDARETLITSLILAGNYRIPEVCVYFNNRLFRGNRTQKVNAVDLDAFDSPNYPPLAEIGIDIKVHWERLLVRPDAALEVHNLSEQAVGAIRLFPGISPAVIRNFLQVPMQAVVLETYGVGNAPQDAAFLAVLADATQRGVVIVNCTQCLKGSVDMQKYATGEALQEVGVVSGYDMTPAAALTKLYFLLSQGLGAEDVRYWVQMNLRGELTPPMGKV